MENRKFGPKPHDYQPMKPCPACGKDFKPGDYTTLVSLGPGDDEEEQDNCREGRPYNAVAVECHWACVTGETLTL